MKLLWKAAYAAWVALSWHAAALHGQQPGTPNQMQTIAAVRFNSLVLQTSEAQRDFAAVQAKYAPRQAQLKALSDEIESSRKQLIENEKLGEEDKAARTHALQTREKQLERSTEDFRSDSQSEAQETFQRIAQKVFLFLHQYSAQHGYATVVDRGLDDAPFVLYAADSIDITDQVLKAYNLQSQVPAPGPRGRVGVGPARPEKPSSPVD